MGGVIQEISEETGSGFNADYLQPGPNAEATKMGQFQFYVDFPTKVSTPKAISTTKKKKLTSLTSSKTKNKQVIEDDATSSGYSSKKTRNRISISKKKKLLSFVNLEDDD